MAKPGPKGKPARLHVIENTFRKDRHGNVPEISEDSSVENDLTPPKKLKARQNYYWNKYIRHTPWLTEYDVPMAHIWVELQTEFEKAPLTMVAARIAQLRVLASELGLNHLFAGKSKKAPAPNDKHFD